VLKSLNTLNNSHIRDTVFLGTPKYSQFRGLGNASAKADTWLQLLLRATIHN